MLAQLVQHPEVAIPVGLLLLAALGLSAYNLLYLAPTGYMAHREAQRQFDESRAEFASASGLVDSIPELKARFRAAADKAGLSAPERAKIWGSVDDAIAEASADLMRGVGYDKLRSAVRLAELTIAQVTGAPVDSGPKLRVVR